MKFETAIFDMDGTLLDSMGMWEQVPVYYLAARGVQVPDGFIEDFMAAPGMPAALTLMIERFNLPLTVDELQIELYETVDVYYQNDSVLKPGVMEMLTQLQNRGVKMAVATASPMKAAINGLTHTGIIHFFGEVFSGEELKMEKKNGPELYDTALAFLGGERATCAVFEDSLKAARTAAKAGYFLAGIQDNSEHGQEELQSLATWYITEESGWDAIFE